MTTYGDVRTWQAGPLDESEQLLKSRSDSLLTLTDELVAAVKPAEWHGSAADAAARDRDQLADRLEHVVAGISAVRSALMTAADRVVELKNMITEADELARKHRFSIDDQGVLSDGGPPPDIPPDQVSEVENERAEVKAELADLVTRITRFAVDVDVSLADVLDKVARGEIDDGGATTLIDAAAAGLGQKPGIPGPPPDPPTDPGAGEHGSDPWYTRGDDLLMAGLAGTAADIAEDIGWTHAAANLRHYLGNSGDQATVNPDEMMRDVGSFRDKVDKTTAAEMQRLADDAAATGSYGKPIQFNTGWKGHYIGGNESKDWFYAMGGVQYAVSGVATVHPPDQPGGQPRVEMDYKTHVFDRYNWDGGKSTEIGPITVTDKEMADMHRAGVAQEFTISGSTDAKHYNGPVPAGGQQPNLPAPPDNRDGDRSDPGRPHS